MGAEAVKRKPMTITARASGHCRYDRCGHRKIGVGDKIRIVNSKWYHLACWRTMSTPAETQRIVTAITSSRQRLAVAIDTADTAAKTAQLPQRARRLARMDAYQGAIAAETRRTIAHYGLGNGPD